MTISNFGFRGTFKDMRVRESRRGKSLRAFLTLLGLLGLILGGFGGLRPSDGLGFQRAIAPIRLKNAQGFEIVSFKGIA